MIFPAHIGDSHWALIVVNNVDNSIEKYDSLYSRCMDNLALSVEQWLHEERKVRYPSHPISKWRHQAKECWKQRDSSSCGIFVCQCAYYLKMGVRVPVSEFDTVYYRNRMAYELYIMTQYYVMTSSLPTLRPLTLTR